MRLKDLLTETFLSLTANKGRSFLTILGIVVGITSVIVMVAFGKAPRPRSSRTSRRWAPTCSR